MQDCVSAAPLEGSEAVVANIRQGPSDDPNLNSAEHRARLGERLHLAGFSDPTNLVNKHEVIVWQKRLQIGPFQFVSI